MENNFIEILYLGNKVKILRYLSESNYLFNQRLKYIENLEKKKIKWKDALNQTNLWYYNKFKNCKYNE